MPYAGAVFVGFGVLVIVFPDLISTIIGILLILIGGNMLLFSAASRKSEGGGPIKFGSYEIYLGKKK